MTQAVSKPRTRYAYMVKHNGHIRGVYSNKSVAYKALRKYRDHAMIQLPICDTLGEYFQLVYDSDNQWEVEKQPINTTCKIE